MATTPEGRKMERHSVQSCSQEERVHDTQMLFTESSRNKLLSKSQQGVIENDAHYDRDDHRNIKKAESREDWFLLPRCKHLISSLCWFHGLTASFLCSSESPSPPRTSVTQSRCLRRCISTWTVEETPPPSEPQSPAEWTLLQVEKSFTRFPARLLHRSIH